MGAAVPEGRAAKRLGEVRESFQVGWDRASPARGRIGGEGEGQDGENGNSSAVVAVSRCASSSPKIGRGGDAQAFVDSCPIKLPAPPSRPCGSRPPDVRGRSALTFMESNNVSPEAAWQAMIDVALAEESAEALREA
jgi:hypothetical protein